jgi:hypothetical protein
LDTVGDAILLILAPRIHFMVAIVLGCGVVLIVVDLAAEFVLLLMDLVPFGRGQLAAIQCAIGVDFLVDRRFFLLHVGRLAGSQLAGFYPLRDAVLLILRPLANFAGPNVAAVKREAAIIPITMLFIGLSSVRRLVTAPRLTNVQTHEEE